MEEVCLNASALSDPNSLRVPLTSAFTSLIIALIDCGSTDCFVDSNFAHTQDLPLTSIPPICLQLLDGTSSIMTMLMFLTKQKLTRWLLTVHTISKLRSRKELRHPLVQCTLFPNQNSPPSVNSSTNISGLVLFAPLPLRMELPCFSLKRRMAPSAFA